jgi:hypothetical protein
MHYTKQICETLAFRYEPHQILVVVHFGDACQNTEQLPTSGMARIQRFTRNTRCKQIWLTLILTVYKSIHRRFSCISGALITVYLCWTFAPKLKTTPT